jgi:hypothetical protein
MTVLSVSSPHSPDWNGGEGAIEVLAGGIMAVSVLQYGEVCGPKLFAALEGRGVFSSTCSHP